MLIGIAARIHLPAPAVSGTPALSGRIASLISLEKNPMPRTPVRSAVTIVALAFAAALASAMPDGAPALSQSKTTAETKAPREKVSGRADYPEALKAKKLQGVVVVEITVDNDGNVTSARGIRPADNADLVKAAVDSIRQWKYSKGDKPVKMTVTINYRVG